MSPGGLFALSHVTDLHGYIITKNSFLLPPTCAWQATGTRAIWASSGCGGRVVGKLGYHGIISPC